jgi:hypothetical protein
MEPTEFTFALIWHFGLKGDVLNPAGVQNSVSSLCRMVVCFGCQAK